MFSTTILWILVSTLLINLQYEVNCKENVADFIKNVVDDMAYDESSFADETSGEQKESGSVPEDESSKRDANEAPDNFNVHSNDENRNVSRVHETTEKTSSKTNEKLGIIDHETTKKVSSKTGEKSESDYNKTTEDFYSKTDETLKETPQNIKNHFRNETSGAADKGERAGKGEVRETEEKREHSEKVTHRSSSNSTVYSKTVTKRIKRTKTDLPTAIEDDIRYFERQLLKVPEKLFCDMRSFETYTLPDAREINYFPSWKSQKYQTLDRKGRDGLATFSWVGARNECQIKCMETVSLNSPEVHQAIASIMKRADIKSIWTSGSRCDSASCKRDAALQPEDVNAWYWTGSQRMIAPTNSTPAGWPAQPWSQTSFSKKTSEKVAGKDSCLSLSIDDDGGATWRNENCDLKKFFICEDSETLLKYLEQLYGVKMDRIEDIKAYRNRKL